MTLDAVLHFITTCGHRRLTLHQVMAGADRPRRPVLRIMDKLTREGYLRQITDNPEQPRYGQVGPPRRSPTWQVIRDLTERPQPTPPRKNTLRGKIWRLCRAKRMFTKADLQVGSGASAATVDEYVRMLERHGYLRRSGKDGRLVVYHLISRQVDRPTGMDNGGKS